MKTHLLLLLSALPVLSPAAPVPVDCHMFTGYQGFTGAVPQCFIDSVGGQGSIVLAGSSRLNWAGLSIGGTSSIQTLTINSNGQAVAIVDSGNSSINGPLSANGRLGIFSRSISVGATGSINAPIVLLSALPAANADQWITTGETTFVEDTTPGAPGSLPSGTVKNQGIIRATQGNLVVLGTTINNGNQVSTTASPILMESTQGDLRVTAAGSAHVTSAATIALTQPATITGTINNFATMRGFTVHLQAVPRYVNGLGSGQTNISNTGSIQSHAGGSGVHLDTVHPSQPFRGLTVLTAGSQIITPNAETWATSPNVRTNLTNVGDVLNPQEDEGSSGIAAPLAIPKFSSNEVVSTNSSAPPLGATYSSLNALPKTPNAGPAQKNQGLVATRGTNEKKSRKPLVKGAFFSLQYRSER